MSILMPLDNVVITGDWGNSPDFYAQFGQQGHNGIDMAAEIGTPVYAADAGTVAFEGWGQNHAWMGEIAGICAIVKHWWGSTGYAHLSSTIVNAGQQIGRGQLLGYSGATGFGTGPHLHFEAFPEFPNFGNGFAGRINPWILGLDARTGHDTNPPVKPEAGPGKDQEMIERQYQPEPDQRPSFKPGDWSIVPIGPRASNGQHPATIASGVGVHIVSGQVNVVGRVGEHVKLALAVDTVDAKTGKRLGRDFKVATSGVIQPDTTGISVSWPIEIKPAGSGKAQRVRMYIQPLGKGDVRGTFIRAVDVQSL